MYQRRNLQPGAWRWSVRVRSSQQFKSELFSKHTHDTLFRFPRSFFFFSLPLFISFPLNTRAPFAVICPGAVLFAQHIQLTQNPTKPRRRSLDGTVDLTSSMSVSRWHLNVLAANALRQERA